jgi:hypothetical protein
MRSLREDATAGISSRFLRPADKIGGRSKAVLMHEKTTTRWENRSRPVSPGGKRFMEVDFGDHLPPIFVDWF